MRKASSTGCMDWTPRAAERRGYHSLRHVNCCLVLRSQDHADIKVDPGSLHQCPMKLKLLLGEDVNLEAEAHVEAALPQNLLSSWPAPFIDPMRDLKQVHHLIEPYVCVRPGLDIALQFILQLYSCMLSALYLFSPSASLFLRFPNFFISAGMWFDLISGCRQTLPPWAINSLIFHFFLLACCRWDKCSVWPRHRCKLALGSKTPRTSNSRRPRKTAS